MYTLATAPLANTNLLANEVLASATEYTKYGWIGYIIIGGLAGWIASRLLGTDAQQGVLLNIVFGVIGGFLGGWLLGLLDIGGTGGFIFTFITALIGAAILIWIWKLISKK
jgi:uncharacterized membrane protein YeaQ/YmgE (transglycosylase-associated protein family)